MAKVGADIGQQLYEGRWWVPGFEKEKQIGEFYLGKERGLYLRLRIPQGFADTVRTPIKVIHGLDEHGKPLTLFAAGWAGAKLKGAFTTGIYRVGYCFHGLHITKWAEAAFDEVEIDFTHLQGWMNIYGFISKREKEHESVLHYELPENHEFLIDDELTLRFIVTMTTLHDWKDFASIRQEWSLRLVYRKPQTFKRLTHDIRVVRRFLSLAVGRPVNERRLILRRSREHLWRSGKRLARDVLCWTPRMRHQLSEDRIDTRVMLFPFTAVQKQFGIMLVNWFSYQKTMRDVLNLYFSTRENPHLYSGHQFLFLAQAMEVYHRCNTTRYSQVVESKANFKERRKRLKKYLSKVDAKWLDDRLQHANQPNLNQRLLEILSDKRHLLGNYLGDERQFAEIVKCTRNYLTHWSVKKNASKYIADNDKLFEVIQDLRAVLLVCFLSDIGVPDSIVKKVLRRTEFAIVRYDEEDEFESSAPVAGLLTERKPTKKPTKR